MSSGGDEIESDWNWDAGIPHYPTPHYHNEEIDFFPRIIGGTPALIGAYFYQIYVILILNVSLPGEFPAKVSIQTRSGQHTCGGALIGKVSIKAKD